MMVQPHGTAKCCCGTSDEDQCLCYCSLCANYVGSGTEDPPNAPCCWLVTIAGLEDDGCTDCSHLNGTYYLYGDECSWSGSVCDNDCGIQEITLTITEVSGVYTITVTLGNMVWSKDYDSAPDCCNISAYFDQDSASSCSGGTCHVAASGGPCHPPYKYCISLGISGMGPYNGNCGCPACDQIDGTYTFELTGDVTKAGYTSLCPNNEVMICTYDRVSAWWYGTDLTVQISSTGLSGYWMTFTGTLDENLEGSLTLSEQSEETSEGCDGTSATISAAVTLHPNPCGNLPSPCPSVGTCQDQDNTCFTGNAVGWYCYADSAPESMEVEFGSTGWWTWLYHVSLNGVVVVCDAPDPSAGYIAVSYVDPNGTTRSFSYNYSLVCSYWYVSDVEYVLLTPPSSGTDEGRIWRWFTVAVNRNTPSTYGTLTVTFNTEYWYRIGSTWSRVQKHDTYTPTFSTPLVCSSNRIDCWLDVDATDGTRTAHITGIR